MGKEKKILPWAFLDEFRGKEFEGQWPTVKQTFHITCLRYPDNTCFKVFTPKRLSFTYREAERKIKDVANYLLSKGVKKGDKIAVSGKNSPEWAIAYLGVLYAGCIVVPLDILLKDGEMETLIKFGGVSRLFIDKDRLSRIDADGSLGLVEKISLEEGAPDGYPYVLDLEGPEAEGFPAEGSDVAAILFTSGTTGTPKGVMLTNDNLISDCYLAQGNLSVYSTDVFYAILPIHHAYTMLAVMYEAFSTGACTVFGKKLVVSQILKELREGQVTMLLAVPMLFNKMIAALMDGVRKKSILLYGLVRFMMGISGFIKKVFKVNIGKKMFGFLLKKLSLESNRICICGGGPLPSSTFKMFNELGIDFVQGYGLTETSPITHLNPTDAYIESSVGKAIPGVETKIMDKDSDGNGTIFIKGPMVMKGYYNNPEATREVLSEDGWLDTGDVGHVDANDYLYLTGRAKNIIVTDGGKNVFPEEIEDHFQLYGEIEQICIIGYLADKNLKAEAIRALIYPSDSARKQYPDASALKARIEQIVEEVNKELQHYKKITRIDIVDEPLEMTSTKKIKRNIVKAKYADKN